MQASLAAEHAELLPQRDTLLFDINVAPVVAVNLAIAVNAATIGSTANATALQIVGVLQH